MRGYTHGGPFQADDLIGYLILKRLFDILLTRGFDIEEMKRSDFVFDIGGIYDHLRRWYDHHQAEGLEARRRPNGVPRAAVGLIWLHYGVRFCTPYAEEFAVDAAQLAARIDREVIEALDASDCGERRGGFEWSGVPPVGIRVYTLTELVSTLNPVPPFDDASAAGYDRRFFAAAELIAPLFDALVRNHAAILHTLNTVLLAADRTAALVVIDANCNWPDVISEYFPAAEFVVYPLEPNRWVVQCVAVRPGSYELRRQLPALWAGIAGTKLQEVTGVIDAIGVGASRFRATVGSREGAIRLAELARSQ